MREAMRAVAELEVSRGAAAFSGTEDLPATIERADLAMYEEKTRNRAGRARRRGASRGGSRFAERVVGGLT